MKDKINAKFATAVRTTVVAAFLGLAGASVALAGPAAATDHGNPSPFGPSTGSTPTTSSMYGNPTAAAPYWVEQKYDDCALMAVADVVGQITGHEPTEQDMITLAENTPSKSHPGSVYMLPSNPKDPNSGMGTDPADISLLLAHYNIQSTTTDDENSSRGATGIEALEQALSAGKGVIVGVNAETLWNSPDGQRNEADHAAVVTGIDTKNGIVHLNDSGTPDGRDEQVPLSTFMKAWKTSDYQMTVTQQTVKK
jgi:Peptidase_C39 like family